MLILTSLLLREKAESRSMLWKYMATLKKMNGVMLRLAETVWPR
jgi:hypothetical protein